MVAVPYFCLECGDDLPPSWEQWGIEWCEVCAGVEVSE